MLKTEHLEKSFGKRKILHDISLEVQEGHIFGLLGTNGAGKSTLLRLMSGIFRPDSGMIQLDGTDVYEHPEIKKKICYLSDEPAFLHAASIADMAKYMRAYYDSFDPVMLTELCKRFSLSEEERIASMSKGTQKRVQVCLALACRPKVLFCDETFDGLDPVMREAFRKTISEETWDRGMITILAGHNQQEMEDICDSVGFLHAGKLLTSGDMDTVISGMQKVQFATDMELTESSVESLKPVRVSRQGKLYVMTIKGEKDSVMESIRALNPIFMEMLPLSLEEVFILEMEEQGYAKN